MEIWSALADLEVAWEKVASLPVEALSGVEALEVLDRLERCRRRLPGFEHGLVSHLQSQGDPKHLGGKSWPVVLTERMGISRSDARRRLADAADLGTRRTVTGEPLSPALPATAAAQALGEIGAEHVTVIRGFMAALPDEVDPETAALAEAQLGGLAGGLTPEGLGKVARELMGYLDPDGTLDDERDHARKRGISLGRQGLDGMSKLTGWVTPGLRAALDALFSKLAAPGRCHPEDGTPRAGGRTCQAQIDADTRSPGQRQHDALEAVCLRMLASGELGKHNGLPVTIVATTTLAELSAGAGVAYTGGGTRLPIPALIRMAAAHGAHPYLAFFDDPRKLRLYYGRRRRTASAAQRLALWALHKGCTKPGCDAPPNRTQVHHAEADWQHGGRTDIGDLTLACGPDNRLVNDSPTGWTTRQRRRDNRTEWTPPKHLDRGQPRVNLFHHPEDILREDNDPG